MWVLDESHVLMKGGSYALITNSMYTDRVQVSRSDDYSAALST